MRKKKLNNLERWFRRNALGEKKESEGKPDDAILIYEANVAEHCETLYPYERLVILYRRRQDRRNEKRILMKAIGILRQRKKLGTLDDYLAQTFGELKARLRELNHPSGKAPRPATGARVARRRKLPIPAGPRPRYSHHSRKFPTFSSPRKRPARAPERPGDGRSACVCPAHRPLFQP